MAKTIYVLSCVYVIFQTVWCQFGETCNTVDGGIGNCISIDKCQQYLQLSQEAIATQVLRKAHCGFEGNSPKVCCPSPGVQTTSPQRPTSTSTTTTIAPVTEISKTPLGDFVGAIPGPPTRAVSDTTFKTVVGVDNAKLGETCDTVDGGVGSCISIYNCQPYLKLSQQATAEATQVFRNAHCGFEGKIPKVCCPAPGTTTVLPQRPSSTTTMTTTTTAAPATSAFIESLPDPPVCGVSNATFNRVVGGDKAKLGDFPWMALLGYKNRFGDIDWLCGGSLISSHHVLTAANCIHNHENDLYVVRLGELDLSREDEGATPYDVLIKQKIKHAEYSANAYANDIGILILAEDVKFTHLIRPICIPKDSELRARSFEDYNPLVAGWGKTAYNGPSATHLQVAQLPVVSNDFCSQAYAAFKEQTIDERVLCAGNRLGGKDACYGDSGGPLMQPIITSVEYKTYFFQIGIVAYGKKCAEPGFPGIYSRITHFIPWIEEQVLGHTSR